MSRNVLITGGTGSIGSSLVRELIQQDADVHVVSRDEHKQYMHGLSLGNNASVTYHLGDVRDAERMNELAKGMDTILHCAAYKHVHICEHNVREAHKTNVGGTANIIAAAKRNDVGSVLLISSDKAANPSSAMGTTKLMAEHTIRSACDSGSTHFAAVRFGNVLGSRGSVIPTLLWQMRHGKPLTVTNPAMTRFFLPLPDATEKLLRIASSLEDGALYVLKMPAATLGDLVEVCIEELAPLCDANPKDIEVRLTGMREGEKLHEQLLTDEELTGAKEYEDMFLLPHPSTRWHATSIAPDLVHSHTTTQLTKEELRPLVREAATEFLHEDKTKLFTVA